MGLKGELGKGVFFIAFAKYSGIVVNLVVVAILARLLTPSDFGVIAVATVFIIFFSLLSDFGIAPAIIQFRQLNFEDIRNIYGFTFWIGLLFAILFFLCAPLISLFYNMPILKSICRILSIQVLFTTLNIVPNSLLLKDKKFSIIAYRTVSVQIVCGMAAVCAAINNMGIYSLLINPVIGVIVNYFINILYLRIKIKLLFSFKSIKTILKFSTYQFLFNFVNYFGRSLDKLIIGRFIGISALGYYEKSYRLMLMPVENITGVLSPVLHPLLSEYQSDKERIFYLYSRITKFLLYVSFPVSCFLYFVSNELVLLVFGNQWAGSVVCFKILSITVALQIPMVTIGTILQSCNKTKLLFMLGLVNVLVSIAGLLLAIVVFKTIEAVSIAYAMTALFSFFNSFYVAYCRCFNSRFGVFLKMLFLPLLFSSIQFFVLYILDYSLSFGLFDFLLLKFIVWGGVYVICLQFFSEYKPFSLISKFLK